MEAKREGAVETESLGTGDVRHGTGDGDDAGPHGSVAIQRPGIMYASAPCC
jgi:hypothetical protein